MQSARTIAWKEVFGEPADNARYISALTEEMELSGHFVDVILTNCEEAINRLMLSVLGKIQFIER
jgi:hypothetical protein